MNNTTANTSNSNLSSSAAAYNDQKQQQLPLKAYFLNKYEQFQNTPNDLSNENTTLKNLLIDSTPQTKLFRNSSQSEPAVFSSAPISSAAGSQRKSNPAAVNSPQPTTSGGNAMAAKRHFSGSNSSLQNSDDDDDFDNETTTGQSGGGFDASRSREEKRRLSHTAAEQKRRNAIKRGYEDLQSIVPSCEFMDESSSQKVCKATVLKRSIDYIHEMEKEKDKHEQDLDSVKKEIMALKIMKSNYEEILQYHRNMPKDNSVEINDEAKFDLFVKFADNLFQSFQSMVNTNSFSDMTSSTLNWLEQMCSSNNLKNLVLLSLFQITQQMLH